MTSSFTTAATLSSISAGYAVPAADKKTAIKTPRTLFVCIGLNSIRWLAPPQAIKSGGAGLLFLNGLPEKAAVKVKPDLINESALLLAQDIARPAYLKVFHGNFKAGPQFGKPFQGAYPFTGFSGHDKVFRQYKIRVSLPLGEPPHPSPELVKIGQAKRIRPVNHDGVHVRDIQPGFDDIGRDQAVDFPLNKLFHDFFKQMRGNTAMRHGKADIRHQGLQFFVDFANTLDPVMDKINLAFPADFSLHGRPDHFLVKLDDFSFDRDTPLGRGGDNRHIPGPKKGHIKGPGDGG